MTWPRRRSRAIPLPSWLGITVGLGLGAFLLAGCGDRAPTLRIDAASSLQPAFEQLIEEFSNEPGANRGDLVIELNVAGSATLATGIIEGTQPDLFASADQLTMDRVVASNLVQGPQVFTRNHLALVTPSDDPAGLADTLASAGLTALGQRLGEVSIAQCSPQVPCGRLAENAQQMLSLPVEPATEETNVRSVLAKVEAGEVDAGFVYLTDALASDVQIVAVDGIETFVNEYPIAVLEASQNPQAAIDFIDFVLSARGQELLAEWGFLPR